MNKTGIFMKNGVISVAPFSFLSGYGLGYFITPFILLTWSFIFRIFFYAFFGSLSSFFNFIFSTAHPQPFQKSRFQTGFPNCGKSNLYSQFFVENFLKSL